MHRIIIKNYNIATLKNENNNHFETNFICQNHIHFETEKVLLYCKLFIFSFSLSLFHFSIIEIWHPILQSPNLRD